MEVMNQIPEIQHLKIPPDYSLHVFHTATAYRLPSTFNRIENIMKLNFNPDGFAVPVDPNLIKQLELLTDKEEVPPDVSSFVFSFRDENHSHKNGGYHPVEIRIYLEEGMWNFDYILNYSEQGGVFPELAAEVSFDFRNNRLSVTFVPAMDISDDIDFFNLWQSNFLAFLLSGTFDEIEVGWNW